MPNGDFENFDAYTSGGPPSTGRADAARRVERNACEAVLRLTDIPAWRVRRDAGIVSHGELTFRHLRDFAGFAATPAVSGVSPDPVTDLLLRPSRGAMWKAWVLAWDERPTQEPGTRALVMAGPGWGTVVAHDSRVPDTPCLLIPVGTWTLVIEPLKAWAARVWARSSPPDAR